MNWIRQFLVPPVLEDEDKTRVAGLLNTILLAMVVIAAVVGIFSLIGYLKPERALVGLFAMILVRLGALFLMHRGHVRFISVLLSSAMWVAFTCMALASGGLSSSYLITYTTLILLAGLLLGSRGSMAFAGLSILAGLGMFYAAISGLLPQPLVHDTAVSMWVVLTANIVMVAVLLHLAIRSLSEAFERARSGERAQIDANRELRAVRASLEHRVVERTVELERRAVRLQVAAEVARVATSMLNLDALLDLSVNLIRQRFDLYYVGLFLLDETGRWAELRAGTGDVGRLMLEQGHRLEVGGISMVGWCTAHAQARVSVDVGEEAVRFDHPLLPNTRSEVALPLIVRGQVIGALDAQSVEEAAFPQEDVMVLQSVASHIAVAIDNARLVDEVQESLAEVQAVHRQYLREAWAGFATTRASSVGYRYAAGSVEPDPDVWLPAMTDAQRQNQVIVAPDEDGATTLSLPIALRGETIGVLGFKKDGEGEWTDDDVTVAQAIADQVALSLENVRLFDEAQRRAWHEALVRELSDKMRRTTDVNTILETAVQGLGKALGSARAFVRLDVPSAE
jgi:GAF domain-containing protein